MFGVAAIPKQGTEQLAITSKNVKLGENGGSQALLKILGAREYRAAARLVFGLHVFVVLDNDRLFAPEIVVGGTQGQLGLVGDISHRGFVEPLLAEEPQGYLKYVGPRVQPLVGRFEHVQFVDATLLARQAKNERVQNVGG